MVTVVSCLSCARFTSSPIWSRSYVINKKSILHNLRLLHPLVVKTFLQVREMVGRKRLLDNSNIRYVIEKKTLFDKVCGMLPICTNCSLSCLIRDMGNAKPHEIKDAMQLEIRTNGEEYLRDYIQAVTEMFTNLPPVRGLSPDKVELLFDCAENVIKCNVSPYT